MASLSAATPLTRKSCAVTLRAYADYRGLDTGVDAAEVAAYLGVSQVQVSRIESRILGRFKKQLAN